jgi:hypothetical protein
VALSGAVLASGCGLVNPGNPAVDVEREGTAAPGTGVTATTADAATAQAATAAPVAGGTPMPVFFVREGQLGVAMRTVPTDMNVVPHAVEALLAGPSEAEKKAGLSSAIPALTKLRSMTLDGGNVVTVDLTGSFSSLGPANSAPLRLAQIVYTITTFPVTVRVLIDGKPANAVGGYILPKEPLSRDDFATWVPPILLESVGPGQLLESGRDISGTTVYAGAELGVQLTDAAGKVLFQGSAAASKGPGLRHSFRTAAQFTVTSPGPATLTLSELSPAPGSAPAVLAVPVQLGG